MSNRMDAAGFWRKVTKGDDCWLWTGATDDDGYGKVGVRGRSSRAHRVAWGLTNGEIPDGLFVLHACDNPPCCNPTHLFLGTNADNMRDASSKGRIPGQQKTHCPQGHEYTPENTRVERNEKGWTMRSCVACDHAYYQEWYAKNRTKKIAASVERNRAKRAQDPEEVRRRQREYTRRSRARRKAKLGEHSRSSGS